MAGYLINLSSDTNLENLIGGGLYSSRISVNASHWKPSHEGTMADFASMSAGDNVFFFKDRKIYGIGELINVGPDCKYLNFPDADILDLTDKKVLSEAALYMPEKAEELTSHRWVCIFRPAPFFFKKGVDMDDLLASDPESMRMVRVLWKLSFIKLDDGETQAFKNILFSRCADVVESNDPKEVYLGISHSARERIRRMVSDGDEYKLRPNHLLAACAENTALRHEMAVELALIHQLSKSDEYPDTSNVFGTWDYLSHQVAASPFKAPDYMDRMDIFGYEFVEGYRPSIKRYLVAELKKGRAVPADVDQLLRYVDWVRDEYCHGDYSKIYAFLVANSFAPDVAGYLENVAPRRYTRGIRPTEMLCWNNATLVTYAYQDDTKDLRFSIEAKSG